MKRIVIIGTSCSGKTTLANNISSILDIPHFELDVLHWGPNWSEREEFESDVEQAVQDNSWVIDGNYRKVRDLVWNRVDTIIWLNYTFLFVFWRALKRSISRMILRKRIFAGNVESFKTTFLSSDSILWWVIKTHKMRKEEYCQLSNTSKYSHLNIIQLNNQNETVQFLNYLEDKQVNL